MMLEPPIDVLVKKAGSPYKLAVMVSKRAVYLQKSIPEGQEDDYSEVTQAVNEVYNDKIKVQD